MIVVTGGAGFIGSNLLAGLEARGLGEVVVCDVLGEGEKWRNIAKREIAEIVPPERLLSFLEAAGGEVEIVFHLGASSSTVARDVDAVVANNFTLSLALWSWCAAHGVRLVYASSAATYGDGSAGFDDDDAPEALARLRPLNPYGWSKHLFDRRVARLLRTASARPPQAAGLKFFNVYGPNEYHKGGQRSVVVQVFEAVAAGAPVRLFKSHDPRCADGEQKRDFVWVGDCVDVMLWLYEQPGVSGVFNVGTGRARSFRALAEAVFAAMGTRPAIEFVDMPEEIRERYQYFTEARMERLRKAGYARPFTTLEDGVARYVKDYLAGPDRYR